MPSLDPAPRRVPPIPDQCAHRPTVAGLVVPAVSYVHQGLAALGVIDPRRRHEALVGGLCQICGQPLDERVYLLVRPADARAGYAPEPALHPVCLKYTEQACPMLSGHMSHYRARGVLDTHPAGRPCDEPVCLCRAVRQAADHEARAGRLADDWDAWMIRRTDYQLHHDGRGATLGVSLDVPVLRRRRVRESQETARMRAAVQTMFDLFEQHGER